MLTCTTTAVFWLSPTSLLLFLLTFDLKYEPPKEEETDGLTHEKDLSKAIEYDAAAGVEK